MSTFSMYDFITQIAHAQTTKIVGHSHLGDCKLSAVQSLLNASFSFEKETGSSLQERRGFDCLISRCIH